MNNRTISEILKETYGQKIYKLSLQSGCSCPNRDGTVGWGGCSFCSEGGSGDFAAPLASDHASHSITIAAESLEEQIIYARKMVDKKIPASIKPEDRKYIAYFQSFTNTYGDFDALKKLYLKTINRPEIVILSIGTRPDCITDEMLEFLSEINKIKPVWIELGLQTIHEETARRINRGYPLSTFDEAYHRLKSEGLTVITHIILGLPGETHEDMYETVRYLASLSPVLDGIKLQLLHILKGTALCREYLEMPFHIMSLEEYTEVLLNCLALLPKETVIHRLTGDGPKSLLVEPKWTADKKRVMNTLNKNIYKQ